VVSFKVIRDSNSKLGCRVVPESTQLVFGKWQIKKEGGDDQDHGSKLFELLDKERAMQKDIDPNCDQVHPAVEKSTHKSLDTMNIN